MFSQNGFELIKSYLDSDELVQLKVELESIDIDKSKGGIRNADKKYPIISKLILSEKFLELAKRYINGTPSLVRSILFDKSELNNWLVAWHQDKTIAVSNKVEMPGWGPWSIKDGVHHVQPPIEVLDKMITFRVHIDPATSENGCLRLLAGSHRQGVLNAEELKRYTVGNKAVVCEAEAGDVLVMKPHIIHSSSKSVSPLRRRVLHIEYSSYTLPSGLSWG